MKMLLVSLDIAYLFVRLSVAPTLACLKEGGCRVRWELHSWKNVNKINKYPLSPFSMKKAIPVHISLHAHGLMYTCAVECGLLGICGKIDSFEGLKVLGVLVCISTSGTELSPATSVCGAK